MGVQLAIRQLYVDVKKTYDFLMRKVFDNILTEFCIPM
jgi:hypothetical protein